MQNFFNARVAALQNLNSGTYVHQFCEVRTHHFSYLTILFYNKIYIFSVQICLLATVTSTYFINSNIYPIQDSSKHLSLYLLLSAEIQVEVFSLLLLPIVHILFYVSWCNRTAVKHTLKQTMLLLHILNLSVFVVLKKTILCDMTVLLFQQRLYIKENFGKFQ